MKASIRYIVEFEMEVDIKTTLKEGLYEFEDYEETQEIKDELENIENQIIDKIDIPENETTEYVKQSFTLTTLYVTGNT